MSSIMKNYYKIFLKERYEKILVPALEKSKEINNEKKLKLKKKSQKEKQDHELEVKKMKDRILQGAILPLQI